MHSGSQEPEGIWTLAQLLQPPKPWADLQKVQESQLVGDPAALALLRQWAAQGALHYQGIEESRPLIFFTTSTQPTAPTLTPAAQSGTSAQL